MPRGVRLATLLTLWLVALLIFVSAFSWDWVSTWRKVGVPSLTPRFADLYVITAGIETLHEGGDPLAANPADPYHRPMNYPRIWLYLFSAARVSRGNMWAVGLLFGAFYLACISFILIKTRYAVDAGIILLTSLSAAHLLAMERGNNDLFVFSLVFLGCIVTNKHLKLGLLGAAGMLKIYPIAAMVVNAIRQHKRKRAFAILVTVLVMAVVLLQWHDLSLIRAGTPIYRIKSYGVLALEQEILFDTLQWGFLIGLGWVVVLECWLAGGLAIVKAWTNPHKIEASITNSRFVEMFCVFGATYVFTYAVGSNWDYRLIFLLPTLPLSLEMARSSRHKAWAIVYLSLVCLAENSIRFEQSGGTTAGHAATFTLFIMLLAMLTRLLATFLKTSDDEAQMLQSPSLAVSATEALHSHN